VQRRHFVAHALASFLLCAVVEAKVEMPKGVPNVRCPVIVAKELEAVGTKGIWIRQIDPNFDSLAFRSPTEKFGQWAEVRFERSGAASVLVVRQDQSLQFSIDKNCHVKKSEFRVFSPVGQEGALKDDELKNILANSHFGIIYVWSPDMVYSMKHHSQFENMAKKLGMKFVSVMDFAGDKERVKDVLKKFGLPPQPRTMASVELYMRGLHHHPMTFVFRAGELALEPIIGVKPDASLESHIGDVVAALGGRRR